MIRFVDGSKEELSDEEFNGANQSQVDNIDFSI